MTEPANDKSETRSRSMRGRRHWVWTLPLTIGFFLLVWELLTRWSGLPAFILPPPEDVWSRFLRAMADGSLLRHTGVTLLEVLGGLAIGLSGATVLGYMLAKSRTLERLLAPYIVASQSIPVVGLIVFFPVLVNTVVGVRSVPDELHDLMRSLRATRWQTFTKLEVPAALPVLFGGLKVGATLSVIGAVVGELVGSERGLGSLISLARGLYDTAFTYVAVFALIAMALSLYGLVTLLERRLLAWRSVEPQ